MTSLPPAFIDCYGDLESRLSDEHLRIVPGLQVFHSAVRDENDLIERLRGRRHVLVYMGFMSERVLGACPELKTIAYLSTGLATHGDLAEAARLGIRFDGVKGYGDRAVAEHAVAMAFAALKQLAVMDREVRVGRWRLMRGEEFAGKTFGIIGLGGDARPGLVVRPVLLREGYRKAQQQRKDRSKQAHRHPSTKTPGIEAGARVIQDGTGRPLEARKSRLNSLD